MSDYEWRVMFRLYEHALAGNWACERMARQLMRRWVRFSIFGGRRARRERVGLRRIDCGADAPEWIRRHPAYDGLSTSAHAVLRALAQPAAV